jgi:transposase
MCRPSLVHPKPIRQLRDLTRYRRSLVRERTRGKQRLEKLLEDAQVKLSSVISDLFGVSGRLMLEAMIAGQRDPKVLAQLSRGSMRGKIVVLQEALRGHFEDHHAFLARTMLARVDQLTSAVEELTSRVEQMIAPYADVVARLDEVTGIGETSAQELVAEIGVDMSRFPTPAHLVSWAKFAPIDKNSAGRHKGGSTGKGNPWLGATMGEVVISASRTSSFFAERYRRLARRRGKQRALVAVGNSVLTTVWHLLSDPDARYRDLGPDFYHSHLNHQRHERNLVRQLEHLTGKKVTLTVAPEQPAA